MFAWRMCHEILHCNANLQQRKVISEATCTRCNNGSETVIHATRDCQKAVEAWNASTLACTWLRETKPNVLEWMMHISLQAE